MKNLSLRKTWKEHRKMWLYLAKTGDGKTYYSQTIDDSIDNMFNRCHLCNYASKKTGTASSEMCYACPAKVRKSCYINGSIYATWEYFRQRDTEATKFCAMLICCWHPKKWNYGKYSW